MIKRSRSVPSDRPPRPAMSFRFIATARGAAPAPASSPDPFYITEEINAFIPVYYSYSEAIRRRWAGSDDEIARLRARLAEYSGIFREAAQLPPSDAEQARRLGVCIAKLERILSEPAGPADPAVPAAKRQRRATHTG